jgi:hypothetical protein
MANFAININAAVNNPPSQLGTFTLPLDYNETHVFTVANFTTETIPPYVDPEGDGVQTVRITSLPSTGALRLSTVAVTLNQDIAVADITAGNLDYVADAGTTTEYSENFTFDIADTGSGTLSGLVGTVSITVAAEVNQPPSVVGDGSETIDYGASLVFTRAMFTTATTPPYSDPEGDAALNLRVTSLPVDGTLQLNGTPVAINQIISFADIDAGLFVYVSDLADTDGDLETFTFEIADAGSGIFVG